MNTTHSPTPVQSDSQSAALTQDELKTLVGQAALQYVVRGELVGVGTGSTVNKFIDALATIKDQIAGAVSSSVASTERLLALGIPVFDANAVERLSVYIDGADEIDHQGHMVKGGGAALTREKIVAALSDKFVCIADESKLVDVLGAFPLPVEIIPMATGRVVRQFAALGGHAVVRQKNGQALVTDNGQHIVDVTGLQIRDPLAFEAEVSQWPGVVTVGVFAFQRAQVCLLGTAQGVKTLNF
jgi:ribose 5-phosphate isomerase A